MHLRESLQSACVPKRWANKSSAGRAGDKDLEHEAVRQVHYIQQALSQNKRPVGFFIGAGCPLSIRLADGSALIPDVAGLTKVISETFAAGAHKEAWKKLLAAVIEDGGGADNIEYILSYIRQLAAVAGPSTVRGLDRTTLDQMDTEICAVISEQVDKALPDRSSAYHDLAIWTRSIRRAKPVQIFTTNYDLLVEQALEESATPYFDGFVGTRKAFFDLGAVEDENLLPARWARLWKIHGSLNWRLTSDGKRVVRSDNRDKSTSYLIYPSHLKYDQSRKMPYLAMLDRLKAFILQPNAILFMSGYSFSDEHINDVICRSLEANPTAQVFGLIYGDLADDRYQKARECGCQMPNLSIMGEYSAIIGRIEGLWKALSDDVSPSIPPGIVSKAADGKTKVSLGNFAHFGNLIRYLTGEVAEDDAA
ncbi:SIR2 family protein [Mesorhizobium sp. B2-5-4]|nr:SIR2 family protein [Mesorhizobium sp. B2-5-4]